MNIQTRITELLGIRYPIIQGGMMSGLVPQKWPVQFQCRGFWEP